MFAGLMVLDTLVFMLIGYFYVYVKHERDYDELGGDQDVLVPESHALDEHGPSPEPSPQNEGPVPATNAT